MNLNSEAARRNKIRTHHYRCDPDCLGTWDWYCPCHPELARRGTWQLVRALVADHVTRYHPLGAPSMLR